MDITLSTQDEVVLDELRRRLVQVRLQKNWTQLELSAKAGVAIATVQRLESGQSVQLTSLIRMLRALGLLARLNDLVPEQLESPLEMLKEEKPRQRASSPRKKDDEQPQSPWKWGDDA